MRLRKEIKIKILKILFVTVLTLGLIALWYWTDDNDYFQTDYRELTTEQLKEFEWQNGDSDKTLKDRYRTHFADTIYSFPGQKVSKIMIFKNIPLFGVFTGKTLKQTEIANFIDFCNDSTNFDWQETTWGYNECEYYIRLYNSNDKVVGKIYLLLDEHMPMTEAKPLSPSMKFGGLSTVGFRKISRIINEKDNWK